MAKEMVDRKKRVSTLSLEKPEIELRGGYQNL
jgi:hypothetical protein